MAANVLNPNILSILAGGRAAGGAPYTPQGPGGSPFITGGGTPYTPNARSIGGGMSIGSLGQWALPRPAGVSLGYIPTPQTIGDPSNAYTAKSIDSYLPPPPPAAAEKPKSLMDELRKRQNENFMRGGSSPGYGGVGGPGGNSAAGSGGWSGGGMGGHGYGGVGGFGGGYK
jgi:hypothetical protein